MKEMARRTIRTFLQAAAGYITANAAYLISTNNTEDYSYIRHALIGTVMAATAAGIAAIMNLPKEETEIAEKTAEIAKTADSGIDNESRSEKTKKTKSKIMPQRRQIKSCNKQQKGSKNGNRFK